MSDGWIEWQGGECPVHPDTLVEVGFRGGASGPAAVRANTWYWKHDGERTDITRYRIVRPPLDFHTSGAPVRADDRQECGDHYKRMAVEPWAVMGACLPSEGFAGYLRGNVLKYAMRAGSKGAELDDARKCAHYAQKWVETLESQ